MDLILWRHAEAIEVSDDEDDLSRHLTSKGERQAQRMAEWLNRHLVESTRILVSPALRCQQTAAALGRKSKTVVELGPSFDVAAAIQVARWPEATAPALLIGHQPTLGKTAGWLLTGAPTCLAIKKGAAWWFRSRNRDGVAAIVLQAVQAPEYL